MNQAHALIIDDEPDILELLSLTLAQMKVSCTTASTVEEALACLRQRSYDFCLTDMKLPDGDGMQVVRQIQIDHNDMPVAIITAHGDMEMGINAMKAGAFDFVSKPVELTRLRSMVTSALKQKQHNQIKPEKTTEYQLHGSSDAMQRLRERINKLAKSQTPVYIAGESGSGKELVARLIHQQSARCNEPFVPVNCGAIPSELMESEFFGHLKGSFTGAVSDKTGLFAAADGGTLFLDEVADLPLEMQVKLLRAIQERAIRPVGSEKEIPVNIRILSATHHDLTEQVRIGMFRQDLFYRINVIELSVPPLRERADDIPELSEFLLNRIYGQEKPSLSKAALNRLKSYPFPGNVRELENILERSVTLASGDVIDEDDLQLPKKDLQIALPERGSESLDEYLESIEKQMLIEALEDARWNKTAAAKKLGITFRALRYKLTKYQLD